MSNVMKVALSVVVLGVALLVAMPQSAQAWKTEQSGNAECSGQNTVVLKWSFKNTEPNQPKWAMDVVARDTVSGKTSAKVTANPGETVTGTIDTGMDSVGKGQIVLELTWTDGRQGVDTRKVNYDATTCKVVEVCRDGEIVTVNVNDVKDSDGEPEDCEEEEEMPEVLPNTGPGAALAGLLGISAIGASLRSWANSRSGLRQRLLGTK